MKRKYHRTDIFFPISCSNNASKLKRFILQYFCALPFFLPIQMYYDRKERCRFFLRLRSKILHWILFIYSQPNTHTHTHINMHMNTKTHRQTQADTGIWPEYSWLMNLLDMFTNFLKIICIIILVDWKAHIPRFMVTHTVPFSLWFS